MTDPIGADEQVSERPTLLVGARVVGLYGRYDYVVYRPATSDPTGRLILFYGENGSGKTTVLRLIWDLLSSSGKRGHRTAIAGVPFRQVSLLLSNGDELLASRSSATEGPYSIELIRDDLPLWKANWPHNDGQWKDWSTDVLRDRIEDFPESARPAIKDELARRDYVDYLEDLGVQPYFLADDRIIYSDELDAQSARRGVRANRTNFDYALTTAPDERLRGVVQELGVSLQRASDYLRTLTLGGNVSGSAGANSVYLDILNRLGQQSDVGEQQPVSVKDALASAVQALGDRSLRFEEFSLVPRFNTSEFLDAISRLTIPARIEAARDTLLPYLNSLAARLDALQSAEELIRTFVKQTNGFLRDKRLIFSPQRGLRIRLDSGGWLDVTQLSSGERQLLLLLCNALLSRSSSRLFLIDEPELSLNATWQRKIVDALLACTADTNVQFLIATHSLELLANYRANVVRLENVSS